MNATHWVQGQSELNSLIKIIKWNTGGKTNDRIYNRTIESNGL
jgi:hypothetical protein